MDVLEKLFRFQRAGRVEGPDRRTARLQGRNDVQARRVTHVVGIRLEGDAQDGNRLAVHRSATGLDDLAGHRLLAGIIDLDHRLDQPQRRA